MSKHLLRGVMLAATLLPAWAAAAPLSIERAVELAVQRSRMTVSARAGAISAAEMARAAGQLPDPTLNVGVDNLPATGSHRFSTQADEMTMKRIGIAQEWVSADKRSAREAVANAIAGRESVMEQVAAADARLQAAGAYVEAYYLGEALKLAMLNERQADEALEAGKGRLATPSFSSSSAEVLALDAALGMAQDDAGELRQQLGAALAALQRWTGTRSDELSPPRLNLVPTQAEFVSADPAVVSREREVEVARRELQATRLDRHPDWTFEVSYGQRQGRADLVSMGISIPLAVSPTTRQDRQTAARQALVDQAQASLEEAQRAAEAEYATLSGDAARLRERIERFQVAVMSPLAQRTATTLAAYSANQASLVMLFEARHAELEAQRKWLGLQRDLARTQAGLVFKPVVHGADS
jgi:outer membrane protein TolC